MIFSKILRIFKNFSFIQLVTESCLHFEELPEAARRNKVPMIFHGVIGQDLKEESSPSFFNIEEIIIVRDYIKKLLEMRQNKVRKLNLTKRTFQPLTIIIRSNPRR